MNAKKAPIEGMTDDTLVKNYGGMVERIAYSLIVTLPANIERDDLVQEGLIALWKVRKRFDPSQGVMFDTFASQRIRGAMLDYLRRENLLSGCNLRKLGKLNRALNGFEHIDRGALARVLNLTLPQLEELLIAKNAYAINENGPILEGEDGDSLLDQLPNPNGDPLEVVEIHELIQQIELALKRHARRAKNERVYTIFQRYLEGDSWSEIAHSIGVNKARMSQIVTGVRNAVMKR